MYIYKCIHTYSSEICIQSAIYICMYTFSDICIHSDIYICIYT